MAKPKKSAPAKKKGGKRRSKAENMTGAKANAVEVRKVGIGDNSELEFLDPNDFDHHYRTIKGLKEKAATANSHVRHAKNAANKTRPGLAATVELTIAIEREDDPVKLKRHLEMLGVGLKQIGSSIQLNVFDSLAGEVQEQAYNRGFADGEGGKTSNSRYPEGSDLNAQYSKGWAHGSGKNMGQTVDQVDAALASGDEHRIAAE